VTTYGPGSAPSGWSTTTIRPVPYTGSVMPCISRPPLALMHASFRVHRRPNRSAASAGPVPAAEEARRHSRRVKTGQQLLHVDPDVALVGDRHHAQVARVREADAYAGPLRGELGLAVAPELPTDPLGGYAQPGADDDPYGAVCDDEPAAVLRMQERFGTLALPVVEHGVQAREDRLRYLRTDQPHVHDVGTHRPPW